MAHRNPQESQGPPSERDYPTQSPRGGARGRGYFSGRFLSTSFQNRAAGLPLISSSVLIERSNSASRSGLKSQRRSLRGRPLRGDRSVTFVLLQERFHS